MSARLTETTPNPKMPLASGATVFFLFLITILFAVVAIGSAAVFSFSVFPAALEEGGTLGSALTIFVLLFVALGTSLCAMGCNWFVDLLRHRGLPGKFRVPNHPLRALAQPLLVMAISASGWAVVSRIVGKILRWDGNWAWLALWIPLLIVTWGGLRRMRRYLRTMDEEEAQHPFAIH